MLRHIESVYSFFPEAVKRPPHLQQVPNICKSPWSRNHKQRRSPRTRHLRIILFLSGIFFTLVIRMAEVAVPRIQIRANRFQIAYVQIRAKTSFASRSRNGYDWSFPSPSSLSESPDARNSAQPGISRSLALRSGPAERAEQSAGRGCPLGLTRRRGSRTRTKGRL